jgi:hypothetical protein
MEQRRRFVDEGSIYSASSEGREQGEGLMKMASTRAMVNSTAESIALSFPRLKVGEKDAYLTHRCLSRCLDLTTAFA